MNSATEQGLAKAYAHLRQHIQNYRQVRLIDFDATAAAAATMLQRSKLRRGTMDIRIAAIALTHGAILLSRNLRDFQRIPDLRVEDWTKP